MKILFLTSFGEDYMADGLLLGLRELFGHDVVDYPKAEILYAACPDHIAEQVRGNGFTLYSGLLEDIEVDRFKILQKVQKNEYDLVVFSDIWRQYGYFLQLKPWLPSGKTIVIDGADSPQVYPFAGLWWRRPYSWFLPRAHTKYPYFKREWTKDSQFNLWHRLLPRSLRNRLPAEKNLKQISFSIPKEKILKGLPEKTKDFAVHCVDPEVAERIPVCRTSYAFNNEEEYYADLQASRFAITTKRAGWDCLRHYEIAANGCVPCFKDLDKKPETCAPHGLVHMANCIAYSDFEDLVATVRGLDDQDEINLRKMALDWANQYSCANVAKDLIGSFICD